MGTVGFLTIGAMAAVIPHVFSDQLGAGRPNDEDRSHMADFAMEILQKVNNWDVECPVIPGDASAPAKRMAYLPKTLDRERCTGCGTCARECPAGAIDAKTQTIDEVKCINCLRCVKKGCGAWSCDYSAITARLEAHYSRRDYWKSFCKMNGKSGECNFPYMSGQTRRNRMAER